MGLRDEKFLVCIFDEIEEPGRFVPDIEEKLTAAFSMTSPEIEIDFPPPPPFLFQFLEIVFGCFLFNLKRLLARFF